MRYVINELSEFIAKIQKYFYLQGKSCILYIYKLFILVNNEFSDANILYNEALLLYYYLVCK